MPGKLKGFVDGLAAAWEGMAPAARTATLLIAVMAAAVIVGVAVWASKPSYRTVADGLEPEETNAVTAKLEASGIPYKVAEGGRAVAVPAGSYERACLTIATDASGVHGMQGWHLFDRQGWLTDPEAARVNYLRALQDELAKTIMKFEQIAFARVHVVLPDPTPFVRERAPASASVVLRLKPGTRLGAENAHSIVSLVCGAVEGLDPENVTIVDTAGRALCTPNKDQLASAASTQLEYRQEIEQYLSRKAETMLTKLLGPGRAVVEITADVDFTNVKETKETYNPDGKVITTEKVTTVKETLPSSSAAGPAGTASNLRPVPMADQRSGTLKQEETVESQYQVSKTLQEQHEQTGKIKRLTVAAMVDLEQGQGADGKAAAVTVDEVMDILKQAVGFDESRGDQIQVTVAPLASSAVHQALETAIVQAQRWQPYFTLAKYLSLAIGSVIALGIVWLLSKSMRSVAVERSSARQSADLILADELAQEALKNPDAVANAVRAWLEAEKKRKETGKVAA